QHDMPPFGENHRTLASHDTARPDRRAPRRRSGSDRVSTVKILIFCTFIRSDDLGLSYLRAEGISTPGSPILSPKVLDETRSDRYVCGALTDALITRSRLHQRRCYGGRDQTTSRGAA